MRYQDMLDGNGKYDPLHWQNAGRDAGKSSLFIGTLTTIVVYAAIGFVLIGTLKIFL